MGVTIEKPDMSGYEDREGCGDLLLAYDQLEEHVREILETLKREEMRIKGQTIFEFIK